MILLKIIFLVSIWVIGMFGGWVKICGVCICDILKLKRRKQKIVSGYYPIYHF